MGWEFEVSRCKLLHLAWLSGTGKDIQSLVQNMIDDNTRKRMYTYVPVCVCMCVCVCVCVYLGHFALLQKLTEHCKSITILKHLKINS